MAYYLRLGTDGSNLGIWKIDHTAAFRIDVGDPKNALASYFEALPGGTPWDTMQAHTPWLDAGGRALFHETTLSPGQYYPRMARPNAGLPSEFPPWHPGARHWTDAIAIARGQLTALTRQLDRICQTVQPTRKTFGAFGHDIRNLLILACTEAESHWRSVLAANGTKAARLTTHDYVKLRVPMKLDEYAVTFPNYPWLDEIRPYKGWGSTGSPTQDLKWYDAYNAAKHSREDEFERATLGSTFEAVTACVVMMAAQFGLSGGLGQRTELESFFHFSALPAWSPSEVYIYPYGASQSWSPVPFKF